MGCIVKPKHRIEYDVTGAHFTAGAWRGRATPRRLAAHVAALQESFKPGGANAHDGHAFSDTRILSARIVNQDTDQAVVEWRAQ
jgi:hypothetical protein